MPVLSQELARGLRSNLLTSLVAGLAISLLTACGDHLGSSTGSYKKLPKDLKRSETNTLLTEAKIVNITDGDTLTVLASNQTSYKIRLQGIDAPEKKQAFGQVCKNALMRLSQNQPAQVEVYKQDRYGRLVAKLTVKGKDLALEQIKAGCGWHYTAYQKEQTIADQQAYAHAEQQARAAKRGLWQDAKPIAPWSFRQRAHH